MRHDVFLIQSLFDPFAEISGKRIAGGVGINLENPVCFPVQPGDCLSYNARAKKQVHQYRRKEKRWKSSLSAAGFCKYEARPIHFMELPLVYPGHMKIILWEYNTEE